MPRKKDPNAVPKPGRTPGKKSYMSKEEFNDALARLGWTQGQAAMHLAVDRATINRMAMGAVAVNGPITLLINYIAHYGGLPRKGWAFGKPMFFRQHAT